MTIYRNAVWIVKGLREFTKGGYQSASRHFNPSDMEADVSQRKFMITGANSGVGKVAALAIAKKGATVHLVCRNKERGEAALKEIKDESNNENVFLHQCDVSKPADIRRLAEHFRDGGLTLNVLINNAGVLVTGDERQMTSDNLETTFATNTLGTHLMTRLMMPFLEAAEDPRVINVTSGGMLVSKLDLSDMQFEKMRKFDGTLAYSQTKRQQEVMTRKEAEKFPKVHFSCMHPGWADTPGVQSSLPDFYERLKDKLRSGEEGADTMVWLAIAPAASKTPSGLFFQDRKAVSAHLPLAWTKSARGDEDKLMVLLDEYLTPEEKK